jgi:hypothetical protein
MRYTRAIPVGLLAAVAVEALFIPSGCSSQARKHPGCVVNIQNTKSIIAVERKLCARGELREWARPEGAQVQDRGSMLPVMLTKLRLVISREVVDPAKQGEALVVVEQAEAVLHEQIAPAYAKAMKSRQADDARAVVAMLDELDRRLDELLPILS